MSLLTLPVDNIHCRPGPWSRAGRVGSDLRLVREATQLSLPLFLHTNAAKRHDLGFGFVQG